MFNRLKIHLRHLQIQDYVAIILGLILLIIIFSIVIEINSEPNSQQQPLLSPTPVPQSSNSITNNFNQVFYNQSSIIKVLHSSQNPTLSNKDILAKAKILTNLPENQQSGVVYQSSDLSINYIHDANEFYVVIFSTNITKTKEEATLWLEANGMSQQAICSYPIIFYPSTDVQTYLQKTHIVFSLLADGC